MMPFDRLLLKILGGLTAYAVVALTVAHRLGRAVDQRAWSEV